MLLKSQGGLSYKTDRGARRKFWKEPLGETKVLLFGREFFLSKEVPILKQRSTISPVIFFFGSLSQKVPQKLRLWTKRYRLDTKTAFYLLKGTTSTFSWLLPFSLWPRASSRPTDQEPGAEWSFLYGWCLPGLNFFSIVYFSLDRLVPRELCLVWLVYW